MKTCLNFYLIQINLKLSEDELKKYCINLQKILSFEDHSDIDGLDLFSELKLLKEVLTNEINTPLKILNYIKRLGSFPNAYIVYRILLTWCVTDVTIFKEPFQN